MTVIQYPDKITVPAKAHESVLGENGEWQTSNDSEPFEQKGRYEPSTLNREIQLADGTKAQVKGIFYSPLTTPQIDNDVLILVTDKNESVVVSTKVLFFERSQMNCRTYL